MVTGLDTSSPLHPVFTKLLISVQVIFDKRIPVKNLNEIKSALVGALASHGQLSGALNLYEEIKEANCHLDPKAIRCLIVSCFSSLFKNQRVLRTNSSNFMIFARNIFNPKEN